MQQSITTQKLIYDVKKDEAFSFEHSLAEYLPGISKVIKAHAIFDNCRFFTENGKAFMEATTKFVIMYLSDFGGKIKNAAFEEAFTCTFKEPFGGVENYTAIPNVFAISLSASPISGRKLRIKGTLHFACSVYAAEETELYIKDEASEKICTLSQNITLCDSFIIQSDAMTTGAEINLEKDSPAASDILFSKVNIHSLKCTPEEGHMKINGKMSLYALYECAVEDSYAEGSQAYASVSSDADFECTLEDNGINEGQLCNACINVNNCECSLSFDSYGENKVISFDIRYTVTACVCENKEYSVTEDVFSTDCILQTQSQVLTCREITKPLQSRTKISETVRSDIAGLYEISGCFANLRSVTKETVSGKAFALAKCTLEIIGTNASGEMLCTDVPVTLHVPIDELENENAVFDYFLSVCSCNTSVKDGALETEIEFDISGVCKSSKSLSVISHVTQTESPVQKHPKGEIILCYPSKDDCVWSLAKRYAVSPESLRQANKLQQDDSNLGKVIIIP